MNFKYSLCILAYADICHLLPETLAAWIFIFIPQNLILKNNLQRQHLLMIPLSQQIREKLAYKALDKTVMIIPSDF